MIVTFFNFFLLSSSLAHTFQHLIILWVFFCFARYLAYLKQATIIIPYFCFYSHCTARVSQPIHDRCRILHMDTIQGGLMEIERGQGSTVYYYTPDRNYEDAKGVFKSESNNCPCQVSDRSGRNASILHLSD